MSKDAQHSGLSTSKPRSRQSRLLPAHRHERPAPQSVQSPHTPRPPPRPPPPALGSKAPRRPAHPRNSPGSSQCPMASNSDSSRLPVWGQAHPGGHCFSHTPGGRAAFQGGHRSPTDSLTPAGPAHGYGHSHRPKCPRHQGRPSEQRVRLWGQPQPTLRTVTGSGVHQDSPTPTGWLQLRDAPPPPVMTATQPGTSEPEQAGLRMERPSLPPGHSPPGTTIPAPKRPLPRGHADTQHHRALHCPQRTSNHVLAPQPPRPQEQDTR